MPRLRHPARYFMRPFPEPELTIEQRIAVELQLNKWRDRHVRRHPDSAPYGRDMAWFYHGERHGLTLLQQNGPLCPAAKKLAVILGLTTPPAPGTTL